MIVAISVAALIAQAVPAAISGDPGAARVEALIARRRFFDAHVHCIVGQALSGNGEEKTWYAIRDAFSLWMLGDAPEALQALHAAPAASERDRELLVFSAAWLLAKAGDEEALRRWALSPGTTPLKTRARIYLDVLQGDGPQSGSPGALVPLARAYRERRTVSPLLSGVLSAALPGAGHAALGLWGDAGLALALNGVSIGATVELGRSHLVFPTIAAGLVASLFYVGAIISSVTLAQERNATEREMHLELIDAVLFPEMPSPIPRQGAQPPVAAE